MLLLLQSRVFFFLPSPALGGGCPFSELTCKLGDKALPCLFLNGLWRYLEPAAAAQRARERTQDSGEGGMSDHSSC